MAEPKLPLNPDIALDPMKLAWQHLGREELLQFVEHRADLYADVITEGFNGPTGVFALVEKDGVQKWVMFDSGFRTDKPPPPSEGLHQPGPYKQVRNGQDIHFVNRPDGIRIEYDWETGRISHVAGADGKPILFRKGARQFKGFKLFPNQHHAEIRLLNWAHDNGYRIVVAAPTRGCCPDCRKRLRQVFKKDFAKTIPKSRWTEKAFITYDKKRLQLKDWLAKNVKAAPEAAKPVSTAPKYVAKQVTAERLARLRARSGQILQALKADPRLLRIAKVLKVAGPAMVAFDAMTSYAKAAEQWQAGAKEEAAETLAEFGGRMAGAFVGAETMGLMFGGLGSVIPGVGTTIGAVGGAVIGGVVGACVGEQKAKEFCHQVIEWAKAQSQAQIHAQIPGAARPDTATPAAVQSGYVTADPTSASEPRAAFSEPSVAELQNHMYDSGYSHSEVNFVCRSVSARIAEHAEQRPVAASEVFTQLASELPPLVDLHPVDGHARSIDDYPWPAFARDGDDSTSVEMSDPDHTASPDHEEVVHAQLATSDRHDGPPNRDEGPGASPATNGDDATAGSDGDGRVDVHSIGPPQTPQSSANADQTTPAHPDAFRTDASLHDGDGSGNLRSETDTSIHMLDRQPSTADQEHPDNRSAPIADAPHSGDAADHTTSNDHEENVHAQLATGDHDNGLSNRDGNPGTVPAADGAMPDGHDEVDIQPVGATEAPPGSADGDRATPAADASGASPSQEVAGSGDLRVETDTSIRILDPQSSTADQEPFVGNGETPPPSTTSDAAVPASEKIDVESGRGPPTNQEHPDDRSGSAADTPHVDTQATGTIDAHVPQDGGHDDRAMSPGNGDAPSGSSTSNVVEEPGEPGQTKPEPEPGHGEPHQLPADPPPASDQDAAASDPPHSAGDVTGTPVDSHAASDHEPGLSTPSGTTAIHPGASPPGAAPDDRDGSGAAESRDDAELSVSALIKPSSAGDSGDRTVITGAEQPPGASDVAPAEVLGRGASDDTDKPGGHHDPAPSDHGEITRVDPGSDSNSDLHDKTGDATPGADEKDDPEDPETELADDDEFEDDDDNDDDIDDDDADEKDDPDDKPEQEEVDDSDEDTETDLTDNDEDDDDATDDEDGSDDDPTAESDDDDPEDDPEQDEEDGFESLSDGGDDRGSGIYVGEDDPDDVEDADDTDDSNDPNDPTDDEDPGNNSSGHYGGHQDNSWSNDDDDDDNQNSSNDDDNSGSSSGAGSGWGDQDDDEE